MGAKRTGTIDRVGSKYRVRLTLPTGERKPLGTYDTREEAEGVRLAAIEALDGRPAGEAATLGDLGEKWLDERDRNHVVRRPHEDRSRWKHHVASHPIASMPIRAIRAAHLDDLVTSIREKKLSRQMIKHVLNLVRGVVRAAIRRGLVKIDPFAGGVPLPNDVRTVDPWTFATLPEQEAIQASCNGPLCHLFAFTMSTGLRAGELCALHLEDVHLDAEHPQIVVRYGSPPREPTKSGKSRTVYLNAKALAAMRAWLAALPTYTASKRFPQGRNPLALAFPRRRGGYRDEAHVIKWSDWKAILKRAGIARRFRFHDLRHTCASALVSGMWGRRWSLEEVKEVLGHTDIAVTQRYAHLATDAIALATKATNGGATTTAADATRATEERAPPGDATHVSEAAVSPRSRSELASELAKAKIALANRAKNKCATGDSNARPTAPEAVALSS